MSNEESCDKCKNHKYKKHAKIGSKDRENPCLFCVKWNSNWNIHSRFSPIIEGKNNE